MGVSWKVLTDMMDGLTPFGPRQEGVLEIEREESYSSFREELLVAGRGMTAADVGVEFAAGEIDPNLVEDELPVSDAAVCV
ncbi:MAG: hypothetical protein KatS3mg107_0207 [Gemmataceae bacterium]|nr:MAG: hypothetical protein KatS3mg107_0207 [Gemmataceae bacterium]